jgi:N6-L-threonylcarbamoyladenine synthase
MIILGIETSCDETSIAVLDGHRVCTSEVYSQTVHARYGGVVPEMASRAHLQKIDRLCAHVLESAGVSLPQIGLIAATDSPGLAGALLVGVSFALGLHQGRGIPVTGVNHLEGHIFSALLEHPDLPFPFLALVVSGGHTAIYRIARPGGYECLGQTVDDAAGEAFDKVGKLLGFPYPAGRAIEQESGRHEGNGLIRFPVAKLSTGRPDFSFSGLKTAVKYFCADLSQADIEEQRPRICRSFQNAVIDSLVGNTLVAVRETGIGTVACVGGVACNAALRSALRAALGGGAIFPSPAYCTDNAAMIALTGYHMHRNNLLRPPRMSPSRGL